MSEIKTLLSKGRDGWQAESLTKVAGHDYSITTCKRSGGKIACTAQKGRLSNGMFSFNMFGDPAMKLFSETATCTDKKVIEIHNKGLIAFNELMKDVKETYKIEVGQVIFTDFSGDRKNRRAIHEITASGTYKTVLLDGSGFDHDSMIRPYTEKFGIGVYYDEGDKVSPEEVTRLFKKAITSVTLKVAQKQADEIKRNEDRAANIETGRPLVTIPEGAVAIIVASRHVDKSDLMTDYFSSSIEERIYLAFSTHHKDVFSEMRKACLNSTNEAILAYAVAPVKPVDADKWWSAPDEHREKYSGGHGYYLGEGRYSGWQISKERLTGWKSDIIEESTLESLYVAAAEGRFLANIKPPVVTEAAANVEKIDVKEGEIQVIEYSEKAIAVIGDTKKIKDKLKALGGSFNPRLSCGAGWIFSRKKLPELQAALA